MASWGEGPQSLLGDNTLVNSDILPSVNNSFSLGALGQTYKDIFVTGTIKSTASTGPTIGAPTISGVLTCLAAQQWPTTGGVAANFDTLETAQWTNTLSGAATGSTTVWVLWAGDSSVNRRVCIMWWPGIRVTGANSATTINNTTIPNARWFPKTNTVSHTTPIYITSSTGAQLGYFSLNGSSGASAIYVANTTTLAAQGFPATVATIGFDSFMTMWETD